LDWFDYDRGSFAASLGFFSHSLTLPSASIALYWWSVFNALLLYYWLSSSGGPSKAEQFCLLLERAKLKATHYISLE